MDSVMRLLGGMIDEMNAEWTSECLFISKESLEAVLRLERAENRVGEFELDEEVRACSKVTMMVTLDDYTKAA